MNDFKTFLGIDREVRKIIVTARQVDGEIFVNMLNEEVKEHIESQWDALTNKELEELNSSTEEEEEEESKEEPAMWTVETFTKVFRIAQILKDKYIEYDPQMESSIKVACMITETLQHLQQHFDVLKWKEKLLLIKM